MQPLDLQKLSWNDFVANAVFWLLDVTLLSILVPFFIRRADTRKWSSARRQVARSAAQYADDLTSRFEVIASETSNRAEALLQVATEKYGHLTIEGREKVRRIVVADFQKYVESLDREIEQLGDTFLQELQLLAPAFNAEIATAAIDFYRSAVPPRSLPLAHFNLWLLCWAGGEENPAAAPLGHPPEKHAENVARFEASLEKLCAVCRVKTNRQVNGNLAIPRGRADGYGGPELYPNHAPIWTSFERVREVLANRLVSTCKSSR